MIEKTKIHSKKIALLLGGLSVLALPPFYQFYILFFTISGLLYLLETTTNYRKSFAIGYWFGFSFFAIGFSWAANSLLVDAKTLGWLYPIALLGFGSFFGLFIALPTMLVSRFDNLYKKLFALACFWTISEWIRSFILTGFPWNLLGSVLAFDLRLIRLANVFGTYGLSYLVIIFCGSPAIYLFYKNKKSQIFTISILIIIPLILYIYGTRQINEPEIENKKEIALRIVQPSIPQKMKWNQDVLEENFKTYIDMSKADGLENIDFVIWGETASPFPLNLDNKHLMQITEAIPKNGHLITGSISYKFNFFNQEYRPANSMFVINKEGKILDSYNKSHLVPFGEYIPFQKYLPSFITPVTQVVGNFIKGDGNKSISINDKPSFGPLICYEIIFPSQIIKKDDRPQWIVNITNDGWYGNSMGPYQHLVTTQLRAIEEGITIVRVANTGISGIISSYGEVIKSIPLGKKDILDIKLPSKLNHITIYSQYGNIIILILCLANILSLFFIKIKMK